MNRRQFLTSLAALPLLPKALLGQVTSKELIDLHTELARKLVPMRGNGWVVLMDGGAVLYRDGIITNLWGTIR